MVDQGIYVIIDGSGSMSWIKHDVVKGINEFIKEQQDEVQASGDTVQFSLVTFDSNVQEVYIKEDISLVKPVSTKDTFLGGGTALLDAVGRTLTTAEDDAALRNIVVIYTDGSENASYEFSKDQIRELFERLDKAGNWQFIFLGAEFEDFAEDAAGYGVMAGAAGGKFSSMNTSKGQVTNTWAAVSATTNYHRNASVAQYDTLRSGERDIASASKQDAGVDWDNLDELTPTQVTEPTK